MNTLLHRAIACMRHGAEPEVAVFFEVLPLTDPAQHLQHLLAPMWGCTPDEVDVQLVCSAGYVLQHWTRGAPATGDARLFELGFGADGRIHYLQPERTMLLVPPAQLQRLVKAQRAAMELDGAGYTADIRSDGRWLTGERRVVLNDLTVHFQGEVLDLSAIGVVTGERVAIVVDDDHGQRQYKVRHSVGGVPVFSLVRAAAADERAVA